MLCPPCTPCCMSLCVVGICCAKFETGQTFRSVRNGHNNSQQCWVRLHEVLSPSWFSIIHLNLYLLLLKIFPRYVNQACLPHQVNEPTDGKRCWITGWGRLSSGGATPELLQQVSVPIVSRARCDKAYPNKIHDSMICAGLDQGGIDSCQGDSGGPMVCETGGRYYLHGATSWGYGCAAKGKFGVYAKVKYLMSWITNEMKKNWCKSYWIMRINVVWGINEINEHVIVFYCEEITNKWLGQICIETYLFPSCFSFFK